MRVTITLFLLLFLIGGALADSERAPAGVKLISRSEVYIGGSHEKYKPLIIDVPQIYGLNLIPRDVSVKVKRGGASYAPCRLENLGNGTDKVRLQFTSGKTKLNVVLIVDENKDGIHQVGEKRRVPPEISLGEGATYHFFVEVTPQDDSSRGTWTWGAVVARSSGDDGPAYSGYNGVGYGGDDRVLMTISAHVE
jgi:hypothetical protein